MEIVDESVDLCINKLKSFYGEAGTLHLSDDHSSFRLELEDQYELIDFETLKMFLPTENYEALCKMNLNRVTNDCKREEQLLRESFQNGGEIPDECKTKLFLLQEKQEVKSVVDNNEEDGTKRKRKE